MAARERKRTRPREHWGMLFAVVLLLCLWFARRIEYDSGPPRSAEAGNGTRQAASGAAERENQEAAPTERNHAALRERSEERRAMVAHQIEARQVEDADVIEAMRAVPRHAFVPAAQQPYAYADGPLPTGEGQTISQPYIVAFMTEALKLDPNSKVLEIGTGSGYQVAVCAQIAREVYTIEVIPSLAQTAAQVQRTVED